MVDVEIESRGFRAMLGFSSKNETRRKLVKKTIPHDDFEHTAYTHEVDGALPGANEDGRMLGSSTRKSSGSTRRNSLFSLPRTNKQSQRKGSGESKTPRELSKASPQAPKEHVLDKDTGERKDLTEMLHAFGYTDATDHSEESAQSVPVEYDFSQQDGAQLLARMPIDIWALISDFLPALDIAHLASTCKIMHFLLIKRISKLLRDPANRHHRQAFLLSMDQKLPSHLFCFPCTQWHRRTHCGSEKLMPSAVLNPLFNCPNSTNNLIPPPRLHITEGRTLPFTFLQLAKRYWAHGPTYGIPAHSLARRWKDPNSAWTHESKYYIHTNGHILMRVKSQVFVSAGMVSTAKRLLIFSRLDYRPYFSVCAHWCAGILTSIPQCALDHIPVPKTNALTQLWSQKAVGLVSLCSTCRPMRRCPSCPTEYLFELKLVEDNTEKGNGPERFKQALLVTRWSDLGDAKCPEDREWAAITGNTGVGNYDSFEEIEKRVISGVFESAFSDAVPGQRILSMGPERERGEV